MNMFGLVGVELLGHYFFFFSCVLFILVGIFCGIVRAFGLMSLNVSVLVVLR